MEVYYYTKGSVRYYKTRSATYLWEIESMMDKYNEIQSLGEPHIRKPEEIEGIVRCRDETLNATL